MSTPSKTIFISDLHLCKDQPALTAAFNKFITSLQKSTTKIDRLYILGDFFNYWIGNDYNDCWLDEISNALNTIAKTTEVYFLAGNRDFLIDKHAAKKFNLNLLNKDVENISVYNKKITVLHGDTLCTKDTKYQKFRKFVRHPLIKFLYKNLPLKIRKNLALKIKQKSNNTKAYQNNPEVFDVCEDSVVNLFSTMNSTIMIHGHTHKPREHNYKTQNNTTQTRYVLGDWHDEGAYYLEILNSPSSEVSFELKYFAV